MNEKYEDIDKAREDDTSFMEKISHTLWGSGCAAQLIVEPGVYPAVEVIQTPSGSLIRSQKKEIIYYRKGSKLLATQGVRLIPRTSGVYWLAHNHYEYFTVGNQMYQTTGQHTYFVETHKLSPLPPLPALDWQIRPPGPTAWGEVQQYNQDIEK